MEKTNFNLEADEAAIVFHKDMSTELILPKITDDETVDFEEYQNIFIAMAISASMSDPKFRELVGEKLNEMFKVVGSSITVGQSSDEKVPSCDPSDCDKGCCGD